MGLVFLQICNLAFLLANLFNKYLEIQPIDDAVDARHILSFFCFSTNLIWSHCIAIEEGQTNDHEHRCDDERTVIPTKNSPP